LAVQTTANDECAQAKCLSWQVDFMHTMYQMQLPQSSSLPSLPIWTPPPIRNSVRVASPMPDIKFDWDHIEPMDPWPAVDYQPSPQANDHHLTPMP